MNQDRWQEIVQLYHSAKELPEDKRAAFLEGCPDEELRREVSSLLENEGEAEGLLKTTALEVAARMKAKQRSYLIGRNIGSYQIMSEIGSGGMGDVYQAKDRTLGREVAIKVLPEEFAKDADRVARFQREARLLASLNHPNIAIIHGLEGSDNTHFLILELVEGDTLSDRIKSGPISVEEALNLALQIAEALEAAHEKGVIHRDLKPANIKITPDGKVKVLDFGLAKAYAADSPDTNLSDSPTVSDATTQQGIILGTAAYMSPEQARGKPVDKRTDIWAFGCVLYEMLTGRAAFSGRDVTEILAAVIRATPDWSGLPAKLHWRLTEVLERCLEKQSKDRYHDIADTRVDIQKVLADPSGVFVQSVSGVDPTRRLNTMLRWFAPATIMIAIIAFVVGWNLRTPEPRQIIKFTDELPKGQQFATVDGGTVFAVSPDGNRFVYSTTRGLYLRSVNERNSGLIPGTEGAQDPFFSPDGQWIGYWSNTDNKTMKVDINGATTVQLTTERPLGYAFWGNDDYILYAGPKGIMRVSANGGPTEILIEAEDKLFFTPRLLPGGKSVIFTMESEDGYKIILQSLESGERKTLLDGNDAQYIPTGHLIYIEDRDLYAVPFDIKTLEKSGEGFLIVKGIYQSGPPQYAISSSGTLVYLLGAAVQRKNDLVWVDHNGKEKGLNAPSHVYRSPRISPDGTQVALGVWDTGSGDIKIWDFIRENLYPITSDDVNDFLPLWTLDHKWILFSRQSGASLAVYQKASNGTGDIQRLHIQHGLQITPSSWSSDGKNLLCQANRPGLTEDIGMLSMEGDPLWRSLLQEDYNEGQPQISPDGQWIAYSSDESGEYEIYVLPFPEVDTRRWTVSTGGGYSPLWSPDGEKLFYRNGDSVMTVTVKEEPDLSFGKPEVLFSGTYLAPLNADMAQGTMWDIHPDGNRFLMIKPPYPASAESSDRDIGKINIVLNWFEELKQKVPVN